jgi:hypothetical protein
MMRLRRLQRGHEMRPTVLFAALVFSFSTPQMARAASAEACPSDNYLYPEPTMEEVCGPVPQANCNTGDGACFAAHEPVSKRHQQCRIKFLKDDKERKEHNALVKRCHGKKVEDQQQKPKSKTDSQGKASDALKAALEDAKRKTEAASRPTSFKDEQEQIRKEGQSHIKQQQQAYQQELAAERAEVEQLKRDVEAAKARESEKLKAGSSPVALATPCHASTVSDNYDKNTDYCLNKYCKDYVQFGRVDVRSCRWGPQYSRMRTSHREEVEAFGRACHNVLMHLSYDIRDRGCSDLLK